MEWPLSRAAPAGGARASALFRGRREASGRRAFGLRGQNASGQGGVKIAVPLLPNIANFDDLDPLKANLASA